jgi:DNA-binding NarL/FixJ family response regulator
MRRVFLADDHQPVRSALRLLLEHEPDLAVVGEADAVEDVVAAVGAANPDLVLLDWSFVERAGRGLIAALRQAGLAARVVALSCRPEDGPAAEDAGADAFVCMGEPPERLLRTVRAVLAG